MTKHISEIIDGLDEWHEMLDQIEADAMDKHIDKMAEEIPEGRIRVIKYTEDNPHGD